MTRVALRHLIVTGLACAVLVVAGGCDTLQKAIAGAPKPTAKIRDVRLRDLTLAGAAMDFDVEVSNPYGVPLPVAAIDYQLASRGASFLSGRLDDAPAIGAHGSRVLTVPTQLDFASLLASVKGVRPGAIVPYSAGLTVNLDAPGVGPVAVPLSKKGTVPVPAVPDVSLEGVRWTDLSFDAASAVMTVTIGNTNAFPLDVSQLNYALALGGVEVADAGLSKAMSIRPGTSTSIEIPLSFSPKSLGLAAFNMLTGSGASYDLSGGLAAGTPFGPITLPFSRSGQTSFGH
ncbi:MAG: LEA type 2 family protein [Phycisphaerales bacterium]|nr:LEA type 2 family protein [Phycisphaerales bacterium]